MDNLVLEQSGIKWVQLVMERSKEHGTLFSVKADARIEDYFRGQAAPAPPHLLPDGQAAQPDNTREIKLADGYYWYRPDGEPLLTYRVHEDKFSYANSFYMGNAGYPFYEEGHEDRPNNKVNLSFLHLKGISEGITFAMKVPMSKAAMYELKVKVGNGIREFVREYLTTIKMVLEVVSYERN